MGDEVIALSHGCVDGGGIYEARRHAWATERVSMIGDEMLDVTGTADHKKCSSVCISVAEDAGCFKASLLEIIVSRAGTLFTAVGRTRPTYPMGMLLFFQEVNRTYS
jgi:hypothetical protein